MSQVVEFVELLDHPNYEILNVYPFIIRKKSNHHIVNEWIDNGLIKVKLNDGDKRRNCFMHRLIAKQFIPNPDDYSEVIHINHDRKDNHLENIAWSPTIDRTPKI